MIRTQIQLTESQMRQLRRAARAQNVSVAEVVRRCVERGIGTELPDDLASRYDRAAGLIGAFRDREGATDISIEHDAYLDDAYR